MTCRKLWSITHPDATFAINIHAYFEVNSKLERLKNKNFYSYIEVSRALNAIFKLSARQRESIFKRS